MACYRLAVSKTTLKMTKTFLYWSALILCTPFILPTSSFEDRCEYTVRSREGAAKTGNFSSLSYPRRYANLTSCTYKFVGLPNEKVQVRFHDFAVVGTPGSCKDYVDVYVKLDHPDHDIFEGSLHGRYCGQGLSVVPHLLMSWNRTLVIVFNSDDSSEDRGFHGAYEFIDAAPYHVGIPRASATHCGFSISSALHSSGRLVTPYYPAMYADDTECQYQFEGKPGERIKVTFDDFSLYHGGDHCPFDYVQIYDDEDGSGNEPDIGTYCGSKRFSVFSSKHYLFIKFKTRSGRTVSLSNGSGATVNGTVYAQLRGFNASYVFSRGFVNLDFMPEDAVHVKGSECDMRVTSLEKPKGGVLTSPYYPDPYPLRVTCYYYLDGRSLERPVLEVNHLDILGADTQCRSSAFLAAYTYGQDAAADSADRYICDGSRAGAAGPVATIVSRTHRLALKFDTLHGNASGAGFQANFRFVAGEPTSPPAQHCHYAFKGIARKQGSFIFQPNVPGTAARHGNGRCTYEFQPAPDEYVLINFESFSIGTDSRATSGCLGRRERLDISTMMPGRNSTVAATLGSYCGSWVPGPIATDWSPTWLHMTVHWDARIGSNWTGFVGSYRFLSIPKTLDRCGADHVDLASGVIVSPGYPSMRTGAVDCVWRISSAKPGSSIYLTALDMDMAGSMEVGCQGAILKVYKDENHLPDYELCGRDLPMTHIVSATGRIKIRFLAVTPPGSNSRSTAQYKGFKIRWQLLPGTGQGCSGFVCNVTRNCIPAQLVCNRNVDCGNGDNSDEDGCSTDGNYVASEATLIPGDVLYIIIGVAAAVVTVIVGALVGICFCIRRLQKKNDGKAAAAPAAEGGSCPNGTPAANGNGHVPSNPCSNGGLRPADVMITSYPPPLSYPSGAMSPSAYLSLGNRYTRCPSTSSSSGGRAMTNSTWLSGRDIDNMACLTVL